MLDPQRFRTKHRCYRNRIPLRVPPAPCWTRPSSPLRTMLRVTSIAAGYPGNTRRISSVYLLKIENVRVKDMNFRVGVPKPKNLKYFCFSFKYIYSKNLKNLNYIIAFILSFIIVDII